MTPTPPPTVAERGHPRKGAWAVRALCAVAGGLWGAWVGFAGYLRVPANADSFGSMLAGGVYAAFALLGFVIGATSAALAGGSVEWLMRRAGAGRVAATSVATLACALALWALAAWVRMRFPGLRA